MRRAVHERQVGAGRARKIGQSSQLCKWRYLRIAEIGKAARRHARILKVGAEIADHAQPGAGIFGITKKALARLFDQMITDFAHEPGGDFPAIAPLQRGLVEIEGLREHIDAAHACGLPYAAWLRELDVGLPIWVNHPVVASS